MSEAGKLKAECHNCNNVFTTDTVAMSAVDLKTGILPIQGIEFECPMCHHMNTFTKEEIEVVD